MSSWLEGWDAMGAFLLGNAALKFCVMMSNQGKRPQKAKLVGYVSELSVHPIKSMKGLKQERALITARGLASLDGYSDRQFMLVDAKGNPINQKIFPSMAVVGMDVVDGHLVLSAPGLETLKVPLNPEYTHKDIIRAWKGSIEAVDCGDAPAQWFCRCFQTSGVRLLYSSPAMQKRLPMVHGKTDIHRQARPDDQMAFSGSTAFLMTNEASLKELNARMNKRLDMRNFRANLVVTGNTAYEEDQWSEVYIGEKAKLTHLVRCGRCVITTVDPDTGKKYEDSDPLRTLLTYRKVEPRLPSKAMFGIYLLLDRAGPVQVGDPVYAISTPRD